MARALMVFGLGAIILGTRLVSVVYQPAMLAGGLCLWTLGLCLYLARVTPASISDSFSNALPEPARLAGLVCGGLLGLLASIGSGDLARTLFQTLLGCAVGASIALLQWRIWRFRALESLVLLRVFLCVVVVVAGGTGVWFSYLFLVPPFTEPWLTGSALVCVVIMTLWSLIRMRSSKRGQDEGDGG
jgi:hypothetical protein